MNPPRGWQWNFDSVKEKPPRVEVARPPKIENTIERTEDTELGVPRNKAEGAGNGSLPEELKDGEKKQIWDVRRWVLAIKRRTNEGREDCRGHSFWNLSKYSDWWKLMLATARDLSIDLVEGDPIPREFRSQLVKELKNIGFTFTT